MKRKTPAAVTPRFGTKSVETRRSSANENVSVPTMTASVAFNSPSRYQRRM